MPKGPNAMTKKTALHILSELDTEQRDNLLQRAETDLSDYLERAGEIIEAVRKEGDDAVLRFTREIDGVDLAEKGLVVSEEEFDVAEKSISDEFRQTLELAASNIRKFHKRQLPKESSWEVDLMPGVMAGERILPIKSVACYCPMGKGSFPSVALMATIPAVMAGVPEVVLFTPPGKDGKVDPGTLVVAKIAGVSRVVRAGGALAVATAAYGTKTIPRCVKFEGPGSLWVVAAKRLLAGKIDSRLPAGPSETIILADPTASPRLCALDLLIESEHGPDSSAFLVTWSREVADKVLEHLPELLSKMGSPRRDYCEKVLSGQSGGVVLASEAEEAYNFVNDYAPEHLQVMSKDPGQHLEHITNASEILLGENTPGSIANYMMGANCILPTNGAAMTHSPLSVRDFLKTNTVGRLDEQGYKSLASHTKRFAEYEGFEGHANAVSGDRNDE